MIPFIKNNVQFGSAKAPKIDDRKWHSIQFIQCHLRSSICRQLSRLPNCTLFLINGMRRWIWFLFPVFAFALEEQPWFGDCFEFHFLGSYAYSYFTKIQNGVPPLQGTFHSNVGSVGFDFSSSPEWGTDVDVQVTETTKQSFNFRSVAFQGRYLWLDDIVGDPISFVTGASARFTNTDSL